VLSKKLSVGDMAQCAKNPGSILCIKTCPYYVLISIICEVDLKRLHLSKMGLTQVIQKVEMKTLLRTSFVITQFVLATIITKDAVESWNANPIVTSGIHIGGARRC
jgi:hypothetical protein